MESWRKAWREGFAPQISGAGLAALAEALGADDRRLLQGATTDPPPLESILDWPVEGACGVSYCGWRGDGLVSVKDVETYFARLCDGANRALGDAAGASWFLNAFDEWPRKEMIANLLPEVEREIARRVAVTQGFEFEENKLDEPAPAV